MTLLATGSNSFKFSAGTIKDSPLKSRMESNISMLLSEINRAAESGSTLNLSDINMDEKAKTRLTILWDESAHFVCDRETNVSKCLKDCQGYQVRNIPVTMKPLDEYYPYSLEMELSISLDEKGKITGVRPTLENYEHKNNILRIQGNGVENEFLHRREILKWIEDFFFSFQIRDLDEIKHYLNGFNPKDSDENERMLLHFLNRMFSLKEFTTKIDYVSLFKSPIKQNIFGLSFHQIFRTDHYEEAGWFFFLMDFNDMDKVQIHMHTWQPDSVAEKEGIFGLDNVFIP